MPDGTMSVRCTHKSLPGHEGYGTIEIIYNFSPGVHVCMSYIPFLLLLYIHCIICTYIRIHDTFGYKRI